ncbi:MAG: SIS domain-containing protein, partial [Clostridia bacterium]|nr:SIS domain-containing protein [Clostridia bacterium]
MLLDRYQQAAFDLLYKARTTQREAIVKVGTLMADALEKGGRVYLNGICHSIEMDLLNRGGGLLRVQLVLLGAEAADLGGLLRREICLASLPCRLRADRYT